VGGGVDDGAGRGERVRDAGGVGAAHFERGLCGWRYIFCGRREWTRGFFGDSVGCVCVCAVCESQKELGRNRKKGGGGFSKFSLGVFFTMDMKGRRKQRKNEMLNKGVCEIRIIC